MASKMDPAALTLTSFVLTEQRKHPEATGDLSIILNAIQTACKTIAAAVRRVGLLALHGAHGGSNASGDEVKKLDVISNEVFIHSLKTTGRVAVMATEEEDEVIVLSTMSGAKYALVFDPLDGSSNIDCNVSVGSIFGIYRRPGFEAGGGGKAEIEPKGSDVLQPGRNLVAAGYCMYGSSTEMVLCFGKGAAGPAAPAAAGGAGAGAEASASDVGAADGGVHVFSLDPATGEFMLTRRNLRMPDKPQRIYSCNEGNYAAFPKGFQRFLDEAKKGDKPYSLRYVGSMVADVHRTLLYGGLFAYGPTLAAPGGKLRLLYEVNPMATILEAAGGKAITAPGASPLDIIPTTIHQRAPIYLGCARDVDLVARYLAEADAEAPAGAGGK